jgi:hypothetical protein
VQFYQQVLEKFTAADYLKAGFTSADIPISTIKTIQSVEAAHLSTVEGALIALGGTPLSCIFDPSSLLADVPTMVRGARLVENFGLSVYLGAAHLIDDPRVLTVAASIASIESRHQTIFNLFQGVAPISQPFDIALALKEVIAIALPFVFHCDPGVQGTHFSPMTRKVHPKAHSPLPFFLCYPSANPPLAVTNNGTITTGTSLQFTSPVFFGTVSVSHNLVPIGAITLSHTRRVHRASTVRCSPVA